MNKNSIGVIAFIVGGLVGFIVHPNTPASLPPTGVHQMPDGTYMSDTEMGTSMQDMMHQMNESLEGKEGAEFDKVFIEEMIVHHEGAVDMAEQALERAQREEIKTLSQAIIDAQNKEIEMMKNWLLNWY